MDDRRTNAYIMTMRVVISTIVGWSCRFCCRGVAIETGGVDGEYHLNEKLEKLKKPFCAVGLLVLAQLMYTVLEPSYPAPGE